MFNGKINFGVTMNKEQGVLFLYPWSLSWIIRMNLLWIFTLPETVFCTQPFIQ